MKNLTLKIKIVLQLSSLTYKEYILLLIIMLALLKR